MDILISRKHSIQQKYNSNKSLFQLSISEQFEHLQSQFVEPNQLGVRTDWLTGWLAWVARRKRLVL